MGAARKRPRTSYVAPQRRPATASRNRVRRRRARTLGVPMGATGHLPHRDGAAADEAKGFRHRVDARRPARRFVVRCVLTLVPTRSRSRGERRALRTFPVVSLRLSLGPDLRPRCLSTPPDTFELHPDVALYGMDPQRRQCALGSASS